MQKALPSFLLLILISSSCGFAVNDHIISNYYLIAADVGEQMNLTYHKQSDGPNYGTVIDETVFAVGYDDKFIVVKQHPRMWPKTITNYFILPIKKEFNYNTKNGLIGPLNKVDYYNKCKELNINIPFIKVYKDLE